MTNFTEEEEGEVLILEVHGSITLGDGAFSLQEKMRELSRGGKKKIVLNFADTTYIDSSGIGELVAGFTKLTNHGATIVLLSLTQRVKDLLQATKLYTVFTVFNTKEDAVRYFN